MILYHIHQSHRQLLLQIEENGGELSHEAETALKGLQIGLNENLASLAYTVKELEDKALLVDNEIKRLNGLKKSYLNNAEYFKTYIDTVMKETGLTKVEENNIRLSYRRSTAVEIIDAEALDTRYLNTVVTPNKTAIKAAIEAGELVRGAEIVERQNLQIK
jgi:hypothetical protein